MRILARRKITVQAGQSSLTLEGGNITFACPGTFTVKGAGHAFEGPGRVTTPRDALPDSRVKLFDEGFVLKRPDTGEPLAGVRYRIQRSDGCWETGVTDDEGRTHVVMADETEPLRIEVVRPAIDDDGAQ